MITTVLDLIGVFINALLGGSVARRRELDLFGYVVIGTVSGLGGGLIRDVLLQHGPPLALTNPLYIPIALAGAVVAFLLAFTEEDWSRFFYVLDAIALCVWAAAGAQRTLATGLAWLPAVLLGTVTAVGGGATRDLISYWRGWNLPGGLEWQPRDVIGKIAHPPLPGRRRQRQKPDPGDRSD